MTCALEHAIRLMFVSMVQDMGRVEAVKAGIMTFLEASADVEPSLPRASWFGGPTDYYLEVGMLVSRALCLTLTAASTHGNLQHQTLFARMGLTAGVSASPYMA